MRNMMMMALGLTLGAASASGQAVLYFSFGTDGASSREMVVAYRNTTDAPAALTLEVYDYEGRLMEVPYLADNNGVARLRRVTQELSAHGSGAVATNARGTSYQKGWMRIVSRPAGAIAVTVHSRSRDSNGTSAHLFSLQPIPNQQSFTIGPFDNASQDQYLIANNSSEADRVTLIGRSRTGGEVCRASFQIQPARWYKVAISDTLPCLAGKPGTLEVQSDHGNVAAMLFLINAAGGAIPVHPDANAGDIWSQLKKRAGVTLPF
ncbi:MAG: hypothetical protein NTV52_28230 [Acidobacteria bacterium]|nr:hypothetical protein [Acidobacteriota bacterium]